MPRCPSCGAEGTILGDPCPNEPGYCLADEAHLKRYARDPLLGTIIAGAYSLVRVLGQGGMGFVYEGIRNPRHLRVALKVLKTDLSDREQAAKRFFREAKILEVLDHPNLVAMHDHGTLGAGREQQLFLAMELLDGLSLSDALDSPELDAERVVRIALGIASGLAAAHRNGIVHRDLKPDNVMLVHDVYGVELAKVLDFGIASFDKSKTMLTQTGMVFGTPSYMSPEQAVGRTGIAPASDVYSFGIILYRMLTGSLPFVSEQPLVILMAHVNRTPPAIVLRPGLKVPSALIELTDACLAKPEQARPADGDALVRALEQVAEDLKESRNLFEESYSNIPVDARAIAVGLRQSPPKGEEATLMGRSQSAGVLASNSLHKPEQVPEKPREEVTALIAQREDFALTIVTPEVVVPTPHEDTLTFEPLPPLSESIQRKLRSLEGEGAIPLLDPTGKDSGSASALRPIEADANLWWWVSVAFYGVVALTLIAWLI